MRDFRMALTLLVLAAGPASAVPPVRAGDDFDAYANAAWARTAALPSGQSSYGPTAMLIARNADRVRNLIHIVAHAPRPQNIVDHDQTTRPQQLQRALIIAFVTGFVRRGHRGEGD